MISQEEAIEIAKQNHKEGFEFYRITHGIPDGCRIYRSNVWAPDDVWCVRCSIYPNNMRALGSSHVVVISKDTGKILYDGFANDEG